MIGKKKYFKKKFINELIQKKALYLRGLIKAKFGGFFLVISQKLTDRLSQLLGILSKPCCDFGRHQTNKNHVLCFEGRWPYKGSSKHNNHDDVNII